MVPPRLVRRLVLAPLAIVLAAAMVVLFPLLALLALLLGITGRSKPHRMRALRLLSFALIWLVAETGTLFMCLGLWLASGFGGRLQLDTLVSVADVWRSLPIEHTVHAKWWRVPAAEVPRTADPDDQIRWLYDWWQRIDDWIATHSTGSASVRQADLPPGTASSS